MARYEHLPIYKKAMGLTIYFEKIVRNFSRCHKYTVGSELREKPERGFEPDAASPSSYRKGTWVRS